MRRAIPPCRTLCAGLKRVRPANESGNPLKRLPQSPTLRSQRDSRSGSPLRGPRFLFLASLAAFTDGTATTLPASHRGKTQASREGMIRRRPEQGSRSRGVCVLALFLSAVFPGGPNWSRLLYIWAGCGGGMIQLGMFNKTGWFWCGEVGNGHGRGVAKLDLAGRGPAPRVDTLWACGAT